VGTIVGVASLPAFCVGFWAAFWGEFWGAFCAVKKAAPPNRQRGAKSIREVEK